MTSPTAAYGPVEVTVLTTLSFGSCVIGTVTSPSPGAVWSESPIAMLR